MKLSIILPLSLILNLTLSPASAEEQAYIFKTADNRLGTKICLSAVTNNLASLQQKIKTMGFRDSVSRNRVKYVTNSVFCNGMDLISFSAKYGAEDTFEYLNKKGAKTYQKDVAEIKIIDVAVNTFPTTHKLIFITSN